MISETKSRHLREKKEKQMLVGEKKGFWKPFSFNNTSIFRVLEGGELLCLPTERLPTIAIFRCFGAPPGMAGKQVLPTNEHKLPLFVGRRTHTQSDNNDDGDGDDDDWWLMIADF